MDCILRKRPRFLTDIFIAKSLEENLCTEKKMNNSMELREKVNTAYEPYAWSAKLSRKPNDI